MRILFLSRWFPFPADNGARIRVYNVLRGLAARHEVTLLSFADGPVPPEHMAAMRQLCARVETVPYRPFQPRRARALAGLLSPLPRSVIDTDSPEMHRAAADLSAPQPFDAVVASQIDMVPYARRLPARARVMEELEVGVIHDRAAAEREPAARARRLMTWWKHAAYVRSFLQDFHGATAVSGRELELIARLAPAGLPLAVVPNGVDTAHYRGDFGPPEPDTLIYNGALSYAPNLDAVSYFAAEILPLVRAARPAARLAVTGRLDALPPARLPRAAGLELTGYLDDIRPAVARSWACVVPLREGGGSRLKILEALAAGTPVVATPKGAEGLNLAPGREILIADTPAAFAEATARLLSDAGLRERVGAAGRAAAAERYDWQPIVLELSLFIERLVAGRAYGVARPAGQTQGERA